MLQKSFRYAARFFADLTKQDLIPQAKLQHPERLLETAIDRYKIDLIIDVGANRGQFAEKMLAMGFKGQILSFEPTRATFDLLASRAKAHKHWTCLHLALGDARGELTINCHRDDSLNSFLKSNTLAKTRYEGMDNATETVAVHRLDTVMGEMVAKGLLSSDFRAFLKLDTQGFDLKVIDGARGILSNVHILQTEASVNPIYEGMPDYRETIQAAHEHGFKPASFVTVSRDYNSLQFVEFDLIATRSPNETWEDKK